MGYIYTGETGTPLKDIINQLGNKNYPYIDCRCRWTDQDGNNYDDFFGACKYEDGNLIPLDGDSYSLEDLYDEWEEWVDVAEEIADGGVICLTVWENGRYSQEWEK